MRDYKPGDTVAYSAEFLRNIVDYSHESASKRFIVKSIEKNPDLVIIHTECNRYINVKNLRPVKQGVVIE